MIVLRHTRPAGHEGLCYGRSDLALGPDFEAEAAAILAGLPAVAAVRSSPLTRCLRLAERIGAARGLEVAIDPRLAELDFGAWEGRAWAEIPRGELDAWAADFHGARPHGGETVDELAARVAVALAEAAPGTLWVAHAGIARAAAALLSRAGGWETRLDFGRWLDLRRR